jgi:hypothetical protein
LTIKVFFQKLIYKFYVSKIYQSSSSKVSVNSDIN